MLSWNVFDSIILLTDPLLLISFWGKLRISGVVLMGYLGLFTRSMKDDCLVLDVAKNKSLARRFKYQLISIEVNYTFINTIWIIVSIWFVYDLSLNNKFSNSVMKVFLVCIFIISHFYQFTINVVQIGLFMLLPQLILIIIATILVKSGKIEISNGSCCHSNCFKIIVSDWELSNLYQITEM